MNLIYILGPRLYNTKFIIHTCMIIINRRQQLLIQTIEDELPHGGKGAKRDEDARHQLLPQGRKDIFFMLANFVRTSRKHHLKTEGGSSLQQFCLNLSSFDYLSLVATQLAPAHPAKSSQQLPFLLPCRDTFGTCPPYKDHTSLRRRI